MNDLSYTISRGVATKSDANHAMARPVRWHDRIMEWIMKGT
jgi:hypothetical protein